MKKITVVLLATLSFGACQSSLDSQTASKTAAAAGKLGPFQAGDKIECFDDVSGEMATIKIVNVNPGAGYVKFQRGNQTRFFPQTAVVTSYGRSLLSLKLTDAEGRKEMLEIETTVKHNGQGNGLYADGGDSRPVDCNLKQGQRAPWPSVEHVLTLLQAETAALVADPKAFAERIHSDILEVAASPRFAADYEKVVAAVRAVDPTLVDSISLRVSQSEETFFVWVSGDADERGESSYGFSLEIDRRSGVLTEWSDVEFTDHP